MIEFNEYFVHLLNRSQSGQVFCWLIAYLFQSESIFYADKVTFLSRSRREQDLVWRKTSN